MLFNTHSMDCFWSARHHTLVLGSSGQLWAFGSGAKGQTGNGHNGGSLTPTLVQFPWTTDDAAAMPSGMYAC